jgi:DNA-binding GntR family transcriptional regulator
MNGQRENVDDAASSIQPIRRTRLVDAVADQLREWILNGTLAPGTQLLQVELAERFGVSRTPLREAFRVLERDGLIKMSNGNKTVEVVDLTVADILDMYELREMVDGFAAAQLARAGLPPTLDDLLSGDLVCMETATLSMDLSGYAPCHTHFHTSIVESCGNRSVQELVPIVRMSSQMMVSRNLVGAYGAVLPEEAKAVLTDVIAEGNRDHRAILDAIRAGDAAAAEAAARRHIRKGMRSIRRLRDAKARTEDATEPVGSRAG